jgi:L-lysine exporter family protein LysE/ArgO
MNAFWTSWSTTVGLLAAIGAQNVFVIESAIQKRHTFSIALTYIVSDFIMMTCGYLGLSVAIKSHPEAQIWLAWIGIIFLSFYGGLKLKASLESQSLKNHLVQPPLSVKKSILKALGFSWFNPHVYVDTLILIPALALQYSGRERFFAGVAGYMGVTTWFLGIATLGTWSSKLFQNPQSWRILNLTTAFIMFWVALKLYKELI